MNACPAKFLCYWRKGFSHPLVTGAACVLLKWFIRTSLESCVHTGNGAEAAPVSSEQIQNSAWFLRRAGAQSVLSAGMGSSGSHFRTL